jgi:site-specific DNA recombinase
VSPQTTESRKSGPDLGWPEAAVYARRSTGEGKKDRENREKRIESTIQTQTQGCLSVAREQGFHVADDATFQEHYTGTELWDRPVLTELRARIRAGEFKALICHSTDRLSREPIHLAILAEECERADCRLIFVTEPLDSSPEAALIRYIKGYAAKIEREKMRERVKRQRAEILSKGYLICQGAPKYGYNWDKKNRRRVIDADTSRVVSDIFKWTIEGLSGRAIADRLNAARVPSPSTRQGRTWKDERSTPIWNNTTISRILNDEAYTGKTFVNQHKTISARKKNGAYRTVDAPREEWTELPAGITPPIITGEMFWTARAVVEKYKKANNYTRNTKRPYLLRGLIFCAECRNPMYPESEQLRVMAKRVRRCTGHAQVYRCSHRAKKVFRLSPDIQCTGGRVLGKEIEDAVWERVVSFFRAPELIAAEVEKVLSESPDDQLQADLAAAEKEFEKRQRVRSKMLAKWQDAVAEDDEELADSLDVEIKRYADDIKAYKAVIGDLQQRIAARESIADTARNFQEYCVLVAKGMKGTFTFEEKRAALQALNIKVFAHSKRPARIQLSTGVVLRAARAPAQARAAP